jgi:hypothetical protein
MISFEIILLVFSILFYQVNKSKSQNEPMYYEPQFHLLINKFKQEAQNRGVTVDLSRQKITFENLNYELAHCYYGIEYFKFIRINRKTWYNLTTEEKEATFFHELGHCVLNRIEHLDSLNEDGCPKSLMHRSHTMKDCYFKSRSIYLDELFKNGKEN